MKNLLPLFWKNFLMTARAVLQTVVIITFGAMAGFFVRGSLTWEHIKALLVVLTLLTLFTSLVLTTYFSVAELIQKKRN